MIHQIEFRAMGSQMSAALDSQSGKAIQKLELLPSWFERWENCLSRFRENSELCTLNRSAGRWVQVSDTLWRVFLAAWKAYKGSGGRVTPLVLNALVSAGYDRSWELMTQDENHFSGSPPSPVPMFDKIETEAASHALRLPSDVRLDFGGIAKGWAAHQAMQRLQPYGPVLVDAGGDISISGLQAGGLYWPVGVVDPIQPEVDLELLRLGRCGVATSGRDFHYWRLGGASRHHIIDPDTGRPANSDALSVTVIAPTVMEAEMAAKTVLILGSQAGLDWLEERPSLAGVLVLVDGQHLYSQRMGKFLWR
jgi:thiamine biosynthesis lipoprotein